VAAPATFVFDSAGALKAYRIGRDSGDRPGAAEVLEVILAMAREGTASATGTKSPAVDLAGGEPLVCVAPGEGTPVASCDEPPPRPSATPGPAATAAQSGTPPSGTPPPATTAAGAQATATPDPEPTATRPNATSAPALTATPPPTPAPPSPAPTTAPALKFSPPLSDFTLPNANGGPQVTLSGYLGKKNVVLVFYRAFW
jgi:hypothetical protein